MSDLNTNPVTSEAPSAPVTSEAPSAPVTSEAPSAPAKREPRKLAAKPSNPVARNAERNTPENVIAEFMAKLAKSGMSKAEMAKAMTSVSKAARTARDTIKPEAMPRKSESSDVIRPLIFANPDKTAKQLHAMAAKKLPSVKLATVATFRGDTIKAFGFAEKAGLLSPAGKKWLDQAARIRS